MSVPVCALLSVRGRHRARSEIWEGAASTSRATAASRYQQPAQKQSTAVRLPRGSSGRFQSSFIVRAAAEDPLAPGDGASERKRKLGPKEVVEESLQILDQIVKEYSNEVLAEEGASEALGEIASEDRQAVLRTAVSRHIDKLDDQFLAVLNQYIGSAMKAEQAETVRILMGVREEVLNAVGDKLPPEVQLVDLLTTVPTVESIDKVLAIANGGGGRFRGSLRVPACSMEKVHGAASRIIEQMEDKDPELVDWRLLVLVCIVRERARVLTRPEGAAPECHVFASGSFPMGTLPVQEAAFMKEMIRVGDPVLRRGLIGQALEAAKEQTANDVEPGTTSGGLTENKKSPGISMSSKPPAKAEAGGKSKQPPIRPGRLMDCVWNARAGVARAEGVTDPSSMSQDPIYQRLTDVYETTLSVLRQMASA